MTKRRMCRKTLAVGQVISHPPLSSLLWLRGQAQRSVCPALPLILTTLSLYLSLPVFLSLFHSAILCLSLLNNAHEHSVVFLSNWNCSFRSHWYYCEYLSSAECMSEQESIQWMLKKHTLMDDNGWYLLAHPTSRPQKCEPISSDILPHDGCLLSPYKSSAMDESILLDLIRYHSIQPGHYSADSAAQDETTRIWYSLA